MLTITLAQYAWEFQKQYVDASIHQVCLISPTSFLIFPKTDESMLEKLNLMTFTRISHNVIAIQQLAMISIFTQKNSKCLKIDLRTIIDGFPKSSCGNFKNCFHSISLLFNTDRKIPDKAGVLLEPLDTNTNPSEL